MLVLAVCRVGGHVCAIFLHPAVLPTEGHHPWFRRAQSICSSAYQRRESAWEAGTFRSLSSVKNHHYQVSSFFGLLAEKIGALNSYTISMGTSAVLIFAWIGISNKAGVIVFCILYGLCSAGISSLPSSVVAISMCPNIRQLGRRLLMITIPGATGLLVGYPTAGAILPSGWLSLQLFSATTVSACFGLALVA